MTDLNKNNILKLLKEFKLRYADEGLKLIGLFGSYARGSNDKFSDVDIAFQLDRKKFSHNYKDGFSKILRIQEVEQILTKAFHTKVDLVSLDSSNETFIKHIKNEMIYV